MKLCPALVLWLAVVYAPCHGVAAADPPAGDAAAAARRVFAMKCAGCHGPDLPKPKGRFGYVLDLRRIAANPEMVIPSRPDESELWALVKNNEMPPPDSPQGPLTESEKGSVRAWIAAGAPDAAPSEEPRAPEPAPAAEAPSGRAVRMLGKGHLLVLHLPIALMIAAGIGELWVALRRDRAPSEAVRLCLVLAAVAAVPTVALGWVHAVGAVGSGELMAVHRWLGTAAGMWIVATAVAAERDARRGARSGFVRFLLAVGVVLVAAAAHFGGLLVHGRDFYDW